MFCDLRGYTAFTETAEPEEVLDFLRECHGALGPLVSQFAGTLDQFSGDGIMVLFSDPVPIPDAAEPAVRMAIAMCEAAVRLIAAWREGGRDLGFGAGIAQGYATLGQIGFSERSGCTAIGTVCNVAVRLCAEPKDGQVLLSQLHRGDHPVSRQADPAVVDKDRRTRDFADTPHQPDRPTHARSRRPRRGRRSISRGGLGPARPRLRSPRRA